MIDLPLPAIERVERYRPIIPDWQAFVESLARPLPLCLWANTLRTDPSTVAEHLDVEEIETEPVGWFPGAFKGPPSDTAGQSLPFVAGLYHIQEEVSLLPVVLLDPGPGEMVLDLCAAPGNKTAQIAVAMENTGTIVANDRSALRMRATRGTLDRLGVINTTITIADAEQFPVDAASFDRVLVDVPCTCEGTSRKNVSAFVASGREKSEAMHSRQLAMLKQALAACRPGGRVVYSTCTYAPEENELVISAALEEFGASIRVTPVQVDGLSFSPGITEWDGRSLHPSLGKTMRVWPHQNDTGGFFVAVLEKAGRCEDAPASRPSEDMASRDHWIDLLNGRFGIPERIFSKWRFEAPNRKYLFVKPEDHRQIPEPERVSDGMPLIRKSLRYPKLTTAGARLVGSYASRNVVNTTVDQIEAYVSREEFGLSDDQAAQLQGTGYVLVRHRRMILGVGIYFEDDRRVTSMFPKVLARAVSLPVPS